MKKLLKILQVGERFSFLALNFISIFPFQTEQNGGLYEYVWSEIRRSYVLQNDETRYKERRDKLYITLSIPGKLEMVCTGLLLPFEYCFFFFLQFMFFGFFQCVDAFLSVMTLLPFRFFIACGSLLIGSIERLFK